MRRRHTRAERQPANAAFQVRDRPLEALPRRIAAPRVIELAPYARPRLHERRSHVNRRHDRARLRIALLTDVNGTGAEVHGYSAATMMTRERSGSFTVGSIGRTTPFCTMPATAKGRRT